MSSLPLTPISEAWSKKEENFNKTPNTYTTPDVQSSILSDLGMINEDEQVYQNEPKQIVKKTESKEKKFNFQNSELVETFKPYSDDYIEMMIYNSLNKSNNNIDPSLVDTIDNIYMLVILILILVSIDVILRFRIIHSH